MAKFTVSIKQNSLEAEAIAVEEEAVPHPWLKRECSK